MRLLTLFLLLFFLASDTTAAKVTKFTRDDRFEFRVYPGGVRTAEVRRQLGVKDCFVFGFYGQKTIQGKKMMYPVDLHVTEGKVVIGSHFGRKVFSQFEDGTTGIFKNWDECLKWGMPSTAVAGADANAPPDPGRKVRRQFLAVKGEFTYHVEMDRASSRDCLRLAQEYGFESIVHGDGGTTLETMRSASILVVYRNDPMLLALRQKSTAPKVSSPTFYPWPLANFFSR